MAAQAGGQRPRSLYDNCVQPDTAAAVADLSAASLLGPQPTQALGLATTVPVNLARSPLSDRHQPTRASVRHSRMLVLSQQNATVPLRYLPPVVKWHNLAALLSTVLTLAGVAGIVFAFLLILQAPFLMFRDLPFWSGTFNLAAGMAGVILVCWCRRLAPGVPAPDWVCEASRSCIILCICFMVISLVTSMCTLVFHILRLIWLFQIECLLSPIVGFSTAINSTVSQTVLDAFNNTTDTTLQEYPDDDEVISCNCMDAASTSEWPGLACPEQREHLVSLLVGSSLVHVMAAVVILGYLLIHWRSRHYNQRVYSSFQRPRPPPLPLQDGSLDEF